MVAPKQHLLIVYHSQSGHTEAASRAVEEGGVRQLSAKVSRMHASHVSAEDLKHCRALVICSPEYFGYMAGAVKDLFDRTYEEVRDAMSGKAYAVVVCAGNDGLGALASIERIIKGFRMKKVQDHVICRGAVSTEDLSRCRILGETLAAGIELGIY